MRIAEQFFNNLIKQFVWVLVESDDQQDYQQHKLLCEFIEFFAIAEPSLGFLKNPMQY